MKKIIILLYVLIPFCLAAQKKQGAVLIDSLVQELPKVPDNKKSTAVLLGNIGYQYNSIGNYTKAQEYYSNALKIFNKLHDENGIARTEGMIGSSYLSVAVDTSNPAKLSEAAKTSTIYKAIDYLNRSISLSKQKGYLNVINTFYRDLAEAQRVLVVNAAKLNARQEDDDDSVAEMTVKSENNLEISNLETRRNQELNDKQAEIDRIKATNEKREQWLYLAGLGILLIVTIFMYRTYKKQKVNTKLISDEKKKSEDLLLNILPAQVAEELKEKGMVHAQHFDNVTVLITDFVGFTNVAERFSPKQLVGELHACFKAFDGMLDRYNIEKIKTVGDAYLAVSGLPAANPNHALDMLAVAIAMRDFMEYRKSQLGDATFEMKIGVHTGSVVAGIVGVKKFAYDIWGDTVNLAARMEQNCEAGKINISESTYQLVKDKYECTYRGEIQAKNKGKLKMYFVEKGI